MQRRNFLSLLGLVPVLPYLPKGLLVEEDPFEVFKGKGSKHCVRGQMELRDFRVKEEAKGTVQLDIEHQHVRGNLYVGACLADRRPKSKTLKSHPLGEQTNQLYEFGYINPVVWTCGKFVDQVHMQLEVLQALRRYWENPFPGSTDTGWKPFRVGEKLKTSVPNVYMNMDGMVV